MEPALRRLVREFPPPARPRFAPVYWERLERGIGLEYPSTFKAFVDAYGGSVWFDTVSVDCDQARTDASVRKFAKFLKELLGCLNGSMYDDRGRDMHLPLYPARGGLLPFVSDYHSGIGCWQTSRKSPDDWPVVYWLRGPVIVRRNSTIAKLLCDFLDAKPYMAQIWGDVREYEPERIRLTEM